MVGILVLGLAIGFVWTTVLNISTKSDAEKAVQEFVDMATHEQFDDYMQAVLPYDLEELDVNLSKNKLAVLLVPYKQYCRCYHRY